MRLNVLILILASFAAPAAAKDPVLKFPIDCVLGKNCYIQNFVDTDPSAAATDFACGSLSYNAHNGTDFALPTFKDMQSRVNVLAAAPGTVLVVRDGMLDHAYNTSGAPDVTGKECGNGLLIDHGDGWTSQYCHLMNGSLAVEKGQHVTQNTPLGHVGLSGQTEFPHVHFTLRKNDELVDPFNPTNITSCTQTNAKTLWQETILYQPTGILSVGIADHLPDYETVKSGEAIVQTLRSDSPAMVVFGFAFGGREGDIMQLFLDGPDGAISDHEVRIEDIQAYYFRAAGREASAPWPPGSYNALVHIIRDGSIVSEMAHQITIEP